VLTEAGLSYLTIIRDAFDRIAAGTGDLFHGREPGMVSVRVTAGFAHLWLAPRLARFFSAEPGIDLRLLTTLWTPLEIDRDADFEIRCGIGAWPRLNAVRLTRDRLFPTFSPALLEGVARPAAGEFLARQRLVHVQGFAEGWPEWLRAAGLDRHLGASHHPDARTGDAPARGAVSFDTATLAIDIALGGGGVLLGRSCFVDTLLAEGRLVAPFATRIKSAEAFYLVERAGERLARPARLLRDWILAEAGVV
jgi:LysR family glycine cleavage system transcriptional activator